MWPFKRKKQEPQVEQLPATPANSIFSIPGNWAGFEEFHGELLTATGAAYMVVGDSMINGMDKRQYKLEFYDAEERMEQAFRVAGKSTAIEEQVLKEIAGHKAVIYLLGETGNLEDAALFAKAGLALLNAGGIAINVETAGKAFSKSAWQEVMAEVPDVDLYQLFVYDSIISDDGTVFSCGMHNLGYKDTVVSGEDSADAINLIRLFGYYQLADQPAIRHGQTFQPTAGSPHYQVTEEFNSPHEPGSIHHNPFGIWRLTKID